MMRMASTFRELPPKKDGSSSPNGSRGRGRGGGAGGGGGGGESRSVDWELRPGGMLVQNRSDSHPHSLPPPTIRLRVKYRSIYHEISICSQATFGELKKKLAGPTNLHHQDQKLFFKGRERDSNAFLDMAGVKEKSKIVLMVDQISQEKRYLEMRKNAKMEKAAKSVSEISLEVDRLTSQVSALESLISKGGRVADKEVLDLIELLMNELIKLDAIAVADGELKLQRKIQVGRVQKCVETLDMLKMKNSTATSNGGQRWPNGQKPPPTIHQQRTPLQPQRPQQRQSTSATIVTTQWETFDSGPPMIPASPAPPLIPIPLGSASEFAIANPISPEFNWEFFE